MSQPVKQVDLVFNGCLSLPSQLHPGCSSHLPLKDADWCGRIPASLKRFRWDVFKMDHREFRLEILAAELLAKVSYKNDINRVQQTHVTQLPTSVVIRQKFAVCPKMPYLFVIMLPLPPFSIIPDSGIKLNKNLCLESAGLQQTHSLIVIQRQWSHFHFSKMMVDLTESRTPASLDHQPLFFISCHGLRTSHS